MSSHVPIRSSFLERRVAVLIALVVVWCGLATAFGQVPERARGSIDPHATIVSSYGLDHVDGQLIGGGPGYAVRFLDGSVDVTPALGRRAPHDLPVRLTLESIDLGAERVCVGGAVEPVWSRNEARVSYERGPGIEERYDVGSTGVELSFAFAERLPGRGDLVVRLRVDTQLNAATGVDLDHLDLTVDGIGGVSIGGITGIDADGERVAGTMRFDGTYLDLILPGAFVEQAAYPLVLDPLIGSITSAGASFDDYEPDMAYDATNDVYLVVWEFRSSATNTQIWAQGLNGDGSRRGGIVFVSTGGHMQVNPAIANIAVTDQFAVVWQDDRTGNFDILARGVNASDGALSSVAVVAGTAADEITPDAGGDATGPDDEALIVWKVDGGDLEAVQLEVLQAQTPTVVGSIVTVDNAPQSANPAIAKSGGAGNRYLVTWETSTANDWFIGYIVYDRDLVPLTPSLTWSGGGRPALHPDVDGDGSRWMFVYQTMETPTSSLGDIRFVEVEYTSTGVFQVLAQGTIDADAGIDEAEPDVAFAGTLYVVVWSEQVAAASNEYRIPVVQMLPGQGAVCGLRYLTGRSPLVDNAKPVVCTQFTGGGSLDLAMLCWEHGDLNNGNSLVMRQRFDSFGGGTVVTTSPGCQGGGTAGTQGPLAIGNPRFEVTLTGADPNTLATVLTLGLLTSSPLPCGSCWFVNAQAIISAPVTSGAARLMVPVPCATYLIGAGLSAQWWSLAQGNGGCPALLGVGTSNILAMTIAD